MTTQAALSVLIVDDEPLARARLATLVGDNAEPRCEVVGQCANGREALAWLAAQHADVALLDIQMPGMTGTALAAQLQQLAAPPVVIFVTAHGEHALAAFELDAADYLTKPVSRERLAAALARAARRVHGAATVSGAEAALPIAPDDAAAPPMLVVSERGRVVRVPVSDVLYLKAEMKYVTLRTAAHTYVLDDSLTDLEQRLGERFLRIHRNALVARNAVRALERRRVADSGEDEGAEIGWAVQIAATGEWLAVSRRQAGAVREAVERA